MAVTYGIQSETVVLAPPALTPAARVGYGTEPKAIVSEIKTDPTKEYVSNGYYGPATAYAQSLPPWIDDITRDFGSDLYERMLLDAQVAGDINSLKRAILANGVSFIPAISEEKVKTEGGKTKTSAKYNRAVALCDFVSRLFTRVPLIDILNDMLDAMAVGNRIAELVWEIATTGPDAGKLVLSRIKPKPRENTAFVIDATGNTVGVLGTVGWNWGYGVGWQGNLIDPEKVPGFLPLGKFAILTYAPKNADPRGTSLLRPAYSPWWMKQQVWADYLRHLAQIGGGVLWGTTAEGAVGSSVPDGNGGYVVITAEQSMVAQMVNIRSGACAAFPNTSTLEALAVPSANDTFGDAIDLYDRQISKAILSQTLATNEGQHQSRAATGSQKDIFDLVVEYGETSCIRMLKAIAETAIKWNFGEAALDLMPQIMLSKAEEADRSTLMTSVASLKTAGFFSPSQYPALDSILGLPIRTPEEVQEMMDRADAAEIAKKAATVPSDPNVQGDPEEDDNEG